MGQEGLVRYRILADYVALMELGDRLCIWTERRMMEKTRLVWKGTDDEQRD